MKETISTKNIRMIEANIAENILVFESLLPPFPIVEGVKLAGTLDV